MIHVRHYTVVGVKLRIGDICLYYVLTYVLWAEIAHMSRTQERARFEETLSLCVVWCTAVAKVLMDCMCLYVCLVPVLEQEV